MYLLRLIFLVLLLVGSPREANACDSWGDERLSHSISAFHGKENTDTSKQDPGPAKQGLLVQRLAKRKLNAFILSFATQNVFPFINGCSFSGLYHSCPIGEDDCIALYRLLRVYRC
jgi:hypothetical protein